MARNRNEASPIGIAEVRKSVAAGGTYPLPEGATTRLLALRTQIAQLQTEFARLAEGVLIGFGVDTTANTVALTQDCKSYEVNPQRAAVEQEAE